MLSLDGVVQLSASDLVGHLNCHYLTYLDLAVIKGDLPIWRALDALRQR
jgi:hypothetical protein